MLLLGVQACVHLLMTWTQTCVLHATVTLGTFQLSIMIVYSTDTNLFATASIGCFITPGILDLFCR